MKIPPSIELFLHFLKLFCCRVFRKKSISWKFQLLKILRKILHFILIPKKKRNQTSSSTIPSPAGGTAFIYSWLYKSSSHTQGFHFLQVYCPEKWHESKFPPVPLAEGLGLQLNEIKTWHFHNFKGSLRISKLFSPTTVYRLQDMKTGHIFLSSFLLSYRTVDLVNVALQKHFWTMNHTACSIKLKKDKEQQGLASH